MQIKQRKFRYIVAAIALVLLIMILRACFSSDTAGEVSYLTETVRRGNITKTVNASGEVAAVQLVNVGAQVSGQIERLMV
jgi:macrolide-specific efflux system membrane fusion protein